MGVADWGWIIELIGTSEEDVSSRTSTTSVSGGGS